MVILLTSNSCWNLFNFRHDLIKELNKKHTIIIVAPYDKYLKKITYKNIFFSPIYLKRNKKSIISDFICLIQYFFIIKKYKPDYLIAFTIKPNIYSSIASFFSKTKTINNITGLGSTLLKNNYFTKFIFLFYKIAFRNSYKIIFQNTDDKELFIKKKISYENNSILIPGSGININNFLKYQYPKNKIFTFLYNGRLIKDKGIKEYIEAAKIVKKKYKKIKFVIMGSLDTNNPNSINKNYLEKNINQGNIHYIGFRDNPLSFIKKVDCIVLPSYREGLSRSLLESMALSKPIITSNVPGCKELVINNSNGFLCEPKSSNDLAEKMIKIITLNHLEIQAMGKKSVELIKEKYTTEIVLDKFLKIIK